MHFIVVLISDIVTTCLSALLYSCFYNYWVY